MIKATKNVATDYYSTQQGIRIPLKEKHLSITIIDFKDEKECDIILLKINEMLKNWKSRTKVF
jgi:hypothetical protein